MSDTIRFLLVGDIVGKPGRDVMRVLIPSLRKQHDIDCVVANGENAAHGSGLTRAIADELFAAGVDVITSGDHIFRQNDICEYLNGNKCIIRPLNYPASAEGRGYCLLALSGGIKIGVINLLGHVFIDSDINPFLVINEALDVIRKETAIIIVDFHAEATSEKIAMGWYLDGRVSALFGTHTHVQTADERVLPNGTAYITDAGMTGPHASVIGREVEPVLRRFTTAMPTKFTVAQHDVRLSGVLVSVDRATGRALSIERIQESLT